MSGSLLLPWWLALWRRLLGLFRRRRPVSPFVPKPAASSLAAAVAARVQAPKRRTPALGSRLQRQVPVTEEDGARLGRKVAVEIARAANEERVQRWLVKSRDGEMYYRTPGAVNQLIKTSGQAVTLPDGTLRLLPPAPRPTKRERGKMKRVLKRKEEAQ